uniref:Uncharacterized protein n=1 Tax=Knipowitschia caucasica TaxID=637954 RepID=A0AAV2JIQ1_KNICA
MTRPPDCSQPTLPPSHGVKSRAEESHEPREATETNHEQREATEENHDRVPSSTKETYREATYTQRLGSYPACAKPQPMVRSGVRHTHWGLAPSSGLWPSFGHSHWGNPHGASTPEVTAPGASSPAALTPITSEGHGDHGRHRIHSSTFITAETPRRRPDGPVFESEPNTPNSS